MRQLIQDLIPHAPQLGLYVAPHIPSDRLDNALRDYARDVKREEVVALYDATLMGSGKDGALFTAGGLVFQNNDLEPIHTVNYEDVVEVDSRRKLFGGRRVVVTVNRGRATFKLEMDFSGKPGAAEYVARFLKEAMLHGAVTGSGVPSPRAEMETDREAVRMALEELRASGRLSTEDFEALMAVLSSQRST